MEWKTILIMAVIVHIYILCGGTVFHYIEKMDVRNTKEGHQRDIVLREITTSFIGMDIS